MNTFFLSTPASQQKWLMRSLILLCVILALVAGYAFELNRLTITYYENELATCQQSIAEAEQRE